MVGKEESEKTSQMLGQCDSLEVVFDALDNHDFSSVNAWVNKQDMVIKNIDFNMSFKLGEMIFMFKDLKMYMNKYRPALKRVGEELKTLRSQLGVLNSDIIEGNGKRSKYKEHVQIERKRADVVSYNLNLLQKMNEEILRIFKMLETELPNQLKVETELHAKN